MRGLCVRPAQAANLPRLHAWLPPGAALALPPPGAKCQAWLVVTDPADNLALACLRLHHGIGLDVPRHWYHVGWVVHAAAELGLFCRLQTLQLGNDLTGASELADIAWQPGLDAAAQAQVLAPLLHAALAAVHAATPLASGPRLLIAELPGLRDSGDQSPFWRGLGLPFCSVDPQQAAHRFGPAWRSHVAALLPRQPVYSAFLPADAQAAVGQADPACAVLLGLLRQAGLRESGHISIDQGGPVLSAPLAALQAPGTQQAPTTVHTAHTSPGSTTPRPP